ncbi:MAG: molybdate ABC transporter substrate-binding protein [Rhodospirillales bacterium]|nr:molybdate ABC transporter substrate-binding protein [Rhodospirillales bacterium]
MSPTMPKIKAILSFALTALCLSSNADAAETTVAVAANFTAAANDIAKAFEAETGHKAVLVFGSTGKLYAQIANGAPFHVFLSADAKTPKQTADEGLAAPGTAFTYAKGKIVLFSADAAVVDSAADVLRTPAAFSKIAIANPLSAPYGAAAVEAMKHLGVYDGLKDQIVQGDSIAQTHQFIMTHNAQLGFVAYAQVIHDNTGSMWLVPESLYTPIRQDAVLLKTGMNNEAAQAFLAYLQSDAARAIIASYGYGLE